MEISLFGILATAIYFALATVALWGIFCVVMVWSRVAKKRFKNETAQQDFLDALEEPLLQGKFDVAAELCDGDPRALSQLLYMGLMNRQMGYSKVRQLIVDRFQRDVLADLEYRLSWVGTVIKSAPMLGLLGTVIGMMGAFATLSTAESVDATQLANDINVALWTTACGLAIAIPLMLAMNAVNVRIRQMEDLVAGGLTQFMDTFRTSMELHQPARKRGTVDAQRAPAPVR